MSQLTDAQLLAESQAIQNQTVAGANTAPVVGGVFVDLTQSKINNDKVVVNITGASDINIPSEKAVYNKLLNKQDVLNYIPEDAADKSTDGTLSANSDGLYPSQKAVKTYVDSRVASNDLDSVLTNGNTSSQQANVGAIGLIGATSGFTGQITQDDYHFDFDTNIGKSFQIEHGAITMSNVTGINNNTSLSLLASNITSQKIQYFPNKNGTFAMTSDLAAYELLSNKSIDATLSANSDTLYPSQKAVKTYVDAHSGGASYVPAISVTYSALASLIAAGSLVQGQKYLINDYRTVHQIPNTTDINTGDLEPLIVTAATSNTLSPVAISTTFPKDIIWYNFEQDSTKVTGSTKGFIYRRIDTVQNNDIPFDFRNVKFRRWQINVTTQDATGAVGFYLRGKIVKKTGTNELYIKLNNESGVLFADNSSWQQLYGFSNLEYISPTNGNWILGSYNLTIYIPCSSLYQDYKMWSNDLYYSDATNNFLQKPSQNILIKTNNVITAGGFKNNTIDKDFYNNTISSNFFSNKISELFCNNLVSFNFWYNTILLNFENNFINNLFQNNIINCSFVSNIIGAGFSFNSFIGNFLFINNSFGTNFNNNIATCPFDNNIIGSEFKQNSINGVFSFNTILNNFQCNSVIGKIYNISFTNSTHIYNLYSCNLGLNSSSIPYLTYINASNIQQIVPATS